jgi:hypothetical protein
VPSPLRAHRARCILAASADHPIALGKLDRGAKALRPGEDDQGVTVMAMRSRPCVGRTSGLVR